MNSRLLALLLVLSGLGVTAQDALSSKVSSYLEQAQALADSTEFAAALRLNHQILSWYQREDSLLAEVYHGISLLHFRMGDYQEAIQWMEKVLTVRQNLYEDHSVQIAMTYNNIGVFHFQRGDYRSASSYYERALAIYKLPGGGETIHLSECYSNVGACNALMGDLEKAKDFFERALDLNVKLNVSSTVLSTDFLNLGILHKDLKNYEKSLMYLTQSLRIRFSEKRQNNLEIANVYNSMGIVYFQIGENKKAINYYKKSIEIRRELSAEARYDNYYSYYNLGRVYMASGEKLMARKSFESSKRILLQYMGQDDLEVIEVRLQEAILLKKDGKLQKAIEEVKRIVTNFDLQIKHNAVLKFSNLPSLPVYLIARNQYSDLLKAFYLETKDFSSLQELIDGDRIVIDLLDYIRYSYEGDISRINIIGENLHVYERHLQSCLQAYDHTKREDFLLEAFVTAERAQCRQLLEETRRQEAVDYARIPEEIQIELRELAIALTAVNDELSYLEEEGVAATDTNRLQLQKQRFDLKQQRIQLLSEVEKAYPLYYQMLYDPSTTSIPEVQQNLLQSDQALLAYFRGVDDYYLFFVTPQIFRVLPLARVSIIDERVARFRQKLQDLDSKQIRQEAEGLFELLLAPLQTELPPHLIILPGGQLSLFPFESLAYPTDDNQTDWLVRKHDVAYIYSATWWKTLKRLPILETKQPGVLAVVPSFGDQPGNDSRAKPMANFSPLAYALQEGTAVQQITRGTLLAGARASKANFMSQAVNFRFLHLATHAEVNDIQENRSYLAFTPDTLPFQLFLSEVYNLDLPTEMVTLSACETGVGALHEGEGVFSLARAFSYAGARSLVTSLWKVDDVATAKIMDRFYQELAKGQSKSEALRLAQVHYLDHSRSSESHPFYWAGFVPYGLMQPINFESSGGPSFVRWVVVALLLLVGIIFFRNAKIPTRLDEPEWME